MNKQDLSILALMASNRIQIEFIENGTKETYLLPDEIFDDLMGTLRRLILFSEDPLKERILELYVYCLMESEKSQESCFYGSSEWNNIRIAVKNFLVHLTNFDLSKWEKQELENA